VEVTESSLDAAVLNDRVVSRRARDRQERVTRVCVRVQRLDQRVDDLVTRNGLQERLACLLSLFSVAAPECWVARATVVDGQVNVLVRCLFVLLIVGHSHTLSDLKRVLSRLTAPDVDLTGCN